MQLDIKSTDILYTVAGFLGASAIIYLGTGSLTELSPVTVFTLLSASTLGFLLSGIRSREKMIQIGYYLMTGISFLSGLIFYILSYSPSELELFFILAGSSVVFGFTGYLLNRERLKLDPYLFRLSIGVIVIVAAGLTFVDVNGQQPRQSLNLDSEVSFNGTDTTRVGSLITQNEFFLPRNLDRNQYRACIYSPGNRRFSTQLEAEEVKILEPGEVKNIELRVEVPAYFGEEEEFNFSGSFTVKKLDSCPVSQDQKTLVITEVERD